MNARPNPHMRPLCVRVRRLWYSFTAGKCSVCLGPLAPRLPLRRQDRPNGPTSRRWRLPVRLLAFTDPGSPRQCCLFQKCTHSLPVGTHGWSPVIPENDAHTPAAALACGSASVVGTGWESACLPVHGVGSSREAISGSVCLYLALLLASGAH